MSAVRQAFTITSFFPLLLLSLSAAAADETTPRGLEIVPVTQDSELDEAACADALEGAVDTAARLAGMDCEERRWLALDMTRLERWDVVDADPALQNETGILLLTGPNLESWLTERARTIPSEARFKQYWPSPEDPEAEANSVYRLGALFGAAHTPAAQGLLVRQLLRTCHGCTEAEGEALRFQIADSLSLTAEGLTEEGGAE